MKVLYEVITVSSSGSGSGRPGNSFVALQILEFTSYAEFEKFKENIEEYESIYGTHIHRNLTVIG